MRREREVRRGARAGRRAVALALDAHDVLDDRALAELRGEVARRLALIVARAEHVRHGRARRHQVLQARQVAL